MRISDWSSDVCSSDLCGSSGIASCSLFWTCTWAMSPLVPVSKVSRIVAMPLDADCDEKYIRPSRPFLFCSMIWVTGSTPTLADAPGYAGRIPQTFGGTGGRERLSRYDRHGGGEVKPQ